MIWICTSLDFSLPIKIGFFFRGVDLGFKDIFIPVAIPFLFFGIYSVLVFLLWGNYGFSLSSFGFY